MMYLFGKEPPISMKKRFLALSLCLLCLLCLLGIVSCGGKAPGETTPLQTTPPQAMSPEYPAAYIGFPYHDAEISEYASISADAYASLSVAMDATEGDVDDYIAALLAEHPIELTVTDRPVEVGDAIYLYYEGSIDGVLFSGGSNMEDDEPYGLEIGSGSFIAGFEEALVGLIPEETLSERTYIDVTFPSDYHAADLAGKAARFEVQIVSIIEGYEQRTELTPEFLAELGFETEESDAVAAYRSEVLAGLRAEIVKEYDAILEKKLLELVYGALSVIRLPETELARQRELILDDIEYNFEYYNYLYNAYYGVDAFASLEECVLWYLGLEDGEDWSAELDRLAAENVRKTLFLYAIAENEGIVISEARFFEVLAELADEYRADAAEIIRDWGADIVYDEAIYAAVAELLVSRATIDNGALPLGNG